MTICAKRCQVIKLIRLQIVVIFTGFILELAKRDNVMHVQFLAILFSSFAALLADVAVALAGSLPLFAPVWAIVVFIATCPKMVSFAGSVLRQPITSAMDITKMLFASLDGVHGALKFGIFALKRRLELRTGKAYTLEAMARGIGIHRNTMLNIANNKTERIDLPIVAKIIEYFRREGLRVELQDLFVVTEDTPKVT
jgi:DNA-binding XRE family transcriptional regulator